MSTEFFADRHIGPRGQEIEEMCNRIGVKSLDELVRETIPENILLNKKLHLNPALSEYVYLNKIREIGQKNKLFRSFIGMGFYNTIVLPVIVRNILENPSWYTSYTPYQAEISQGRLEALLNFQTMVISLTGMEIANASLLDESTAAAEAMIMMFNLRSRQAIKDGKNKFFVDKNSFPQNIEVLIARAEPLGIEIVVGNYSEMDKMEDLFGSILQYPNADGEIPDYRSFVNKAHDNEVLIAVIADLMSLAILTPPGEWEADIVVGSTQRFGIPLGYGGPHAGYFATREKYKRNIPGRIIGITIDRYNNRAFRMALQTREQHIKREKATSNICTAQALLATMAGMYAVYHGPEGMDRIAGDIHSVAVYLSDELEKLGFKNLNKNYFDTLKIKLPSQFKMEDLKTLAIEGEVNFHYFDESYVGISADETIQIEDINKILEIFGKLAKKKAPITENFPVKSELSPQFKRTSNILTEEVFNKCRSETDLMRYIKKLERKDISLTHSMISLGSCTMKLNAASELMAFLMPEFSDIHPFVPVDQAQGYQILMDELKKDLKEITGFDDVSFQPNSGAAGEYAGLMVIRAYHRSRGDSKRNICLIPASAHGTNPASAVMAGLQVVVVPCDENGNISVVALAELAQTHKDNLAGCMITYPSTHGVFEEKIVEMIDIIHQNGGQVYMDGANMNAQVGLTNPGKIGADVCHLNLHKTFAIPHGGGGPGVGPIAVAAHLSQFLPGHPMVKIGGNSGINALASAPFGSASILTISHAYIKLLGEEGLSRSTKMAILNANYLAKELSSGFKILYRGKNGRVGHEMILDCREFKSLAGITETDIAKRLMDYGFHAPTLSFPVHGTLMIEPTESESKAELDKFVSALRSILNEIMEVKDGKADTIDNVLKNAPHTVNECSIDEWNHKYSRSKAAFPLDWIRENKFWPAVGRVDDAYGDRNLICSCPPIEAYTVD
ncbi:MAG: aminomethyl-transferring glycine dehydrogenase [Bacteroidales bacterium]|nr:aminomethyl-transferring glycine dehydrogenase [Bacteroidales bacterium]